VGLDLPDFHYACPIGYLHSHSAHQGCTVLLRNVNKWCRMVRGSRPFRSTLQLAHVCIQTNMGKFNKYKNSLRNVTPVLIKGCNGSLLVVYSARLSTTYSVKYLMHSIHIVKCHYSTPVC